MTALFVVLAVVVLAVLVVFALASRRPDEFSVQRRIRIQAPPARIEPLLVDFRQWPSWSPWEHIDPTMKRTLSGAASGPGAVYEWSGSGKAGAGRMEIREVAPARKVTIQLDFIKPFAAHNVAEFTLVPDGDGTELTWRMHGPALLVSKVMGLFVDMDRMVGKDFEAGLAQMKIAAER